MKIEPHIETDCPVCGGLNTSCPDGCQRPVAAMTDDLRTVLEGAIDEVVKADALADSHEAFVKKLTDAAIAHYTTHLDAVNAMTARIAQLEASIADEREDAARAALDAACGTYSEVVVVAGNEMSFSEATLALQKHFTAIRDLNPAQFRSRQP